MVCPVTFPYVESWLGLSVTEELDAEILDLKLALLSAMVHLQTTNPTEKVKYLFISKIIQYSAFK